MPEKTYSLSRHTAEELISHVLRYTEEKWSVTVQRRDLDEELTVIQIYTFRFLHGALPVIMSGAEIVINLSFLKGRGEVKVVSNIGRMGMSMIGAVVEGFKAARILNSIRAEMDRYMS